MKTAERGLPAREFVRAVRDYCAAHELLGHGDGVVAAVSGGPDSVALLTALKELSRPLGLKLHVVHLDHRLRRGSAADGDFVRKLAAQLGLRATVGRTDVRALARQRRCSLEEAGRLARYSLFYRVARKLGFMRVAVGHNRDDQAETVLMRFLRGSSASGLAGISPKRLLEDPLGRSSRGGRSCWVIRPLLARSRAEIESFLRLRGARWRRDPSNADQAFSRNRIRHELIPLLERRYNPAVRLALARAAQALGEEDAFLEDAARKAFGEISRRAAGGVRLRLEKAARLPLPLRRRVFRLAAVAAGADLPRLTQAHLDALVALVIPGIPRRAEAHLPGAIAVRSGKVLDLKRSPH